MASIYPDASSVCNSNLFPNPPQALSTYGSDSQMTSLLNEMDVFVLPVFNVDGYDFTHKSVCSNCKRIYIYSSAQRTQYCIVVLENLLIR